MTLVTSIYYVVCEFSAPNAYILWAVLALDIFLVIMWLAAFAVLAAEVSVLFVYFGYDYSYVDYYYNSDYNDLPLIVTSCLAAASGLGGVQL